MTVMNLPLLFLLLGHASGDSYNEELKVSRLPSGNLMTTFRFTITSDSLHLGPSYSLFPRIMAELISSHSLSELSFILTQGRWHSSRWGLPPQPNGPTGASVYAWIYGNETAVDGKWRTLINSLNGLLCTAMTSVVPELTASPNLAFRKLGSDKEREMHLRYSAVGKESVCTENMTPWRKLLPCKQHGLVTLLNPLKLYESVYHAIGLELYQHSQGATSNYRLQLVMYNVLDVPVRSGKLDWSIFELFNRKATGNCAVAESSKIIVELDKGIHLEPPPSEIVDGSFGVYDLKKNISDTSFTVSATYDDVFNPAWDEEQGTLSVSSFIGGTDQQCGVLVSILKNGEAPLRITYSHYLPWFMLIYYHTLSVTCVDLKYGNEQVPTIHNRHFVPSIARKRPALIELELDLPSRSKCRIQVEFEKAFLRIREYPPDANHGMYVPAAVVTFEKDSGDVVLGNQDVLKLTTKSKGTGVERITLHGNVLLLALPVPDFSMPFNVICFVMTTVSLCFGPIHSFSTKILIPVNSALPSSSLARKLFRVFLLTLLGLAFYAQYREMSLHEIRRSIEQFFEKMNSV